MSKVICTSCNHKMTHLRSGVYVLETYDGTKPYKVWSADLHSCELCDNEVVTGFGNEPISQDFKEDFQKWVDKCEFQYR